jgi:hypothetical protein
LLFDQDFVPLAEQQHAFFAFSIQRVAEQWNAKSQQSS